MNFLAILALFIAPYSFSSRPLPWSLGTISGTVFLIGSPTAAPRRNFPSIYSDAHMTGLSGSIEAVRRKVRALAALAKDPSASENERATAQALKGRLQQRPNLAGAPAGDWSDQGFRLGRWTKAMRSSASAKATTEDWTDAARQAGKALRRGYKRWLSE